MREKMNNHAAGSAHKGSVRISAVLLSVMLVLQGMPVFGSLAASDDAGGTSTTGVLENTVIYSENFESVTHFTALGWEISESFRSNTAEWTIDNGKLLVDNTLTDTRTSMTDSYAIAVPASTMKEVVKGDYTVQWDMTYLAASDAARYITVLLNYDPSGGNSYVSFHFRPKGYADFQSRTSGTWANLDASGSTENGVTRPSAKNTDPTVGDPICKLLWGKDYVDADTLLIMNELITVRLEYHYGETLKVFMNDVFITATDADGWEKVQALADYSAVAVKISSGCKATIDNFVVAAGIGIPEDPFAERTTVITATDISDSVGYVYQFIDDASPARVIRDDAVKYEAEDYATVAPVMPGTATRTIDGVNYDVIWHQGELAQAKTSYVVNVAEAGEYELVICGAGVQNESTPSERGISWWLEGGERYQAVMTPIISTSYNYNNLPREGYAMGYIYNIPLTLKAGENILNFGYHTELGILGRINFDCFYIQKPAAADVVSGDFLYRTPVESEDCITITGYIGAGGAVTVPATLDGYPVHEIGARAFMGRTDITSVTLPETLGWISEGAFAGCTGLREMPKSASLVQIGSYAFYACDGLTSVSLPDTLEFIGEGVFADCNGISEVSFPAGGDELYFNRLFISCDSLTKAVFSCNAPQRMGDNILPAGCSIFVSADATGWTFPTWNGYSTYLIGDDITVYIENGYQYQKLNGGTTARVVGYDASVITTAAQIPETLGGLPVTEIGEKAFYENTALKTVTIPSTVKRIYDYAFYGCTALTTVSLTDGLIMIGDRVFQGCSVLSTITLPPTLTSIGDAVFDSCAKLTHMEIPDSVAEIGDFLFAKCTSLLTVSLPAGMTKIPDRMFRYCSSLEAITLPAGITSIGEYAFDRCSNLRTVFFLGDAPTEFGGYPFGSTPSDLTFCVRTSGTNWTYPTWVGPDGETYNTAIVKDDKFFYRTINDNTAVSLVYYCGTETEVVIPDTFDSLPVTEINGGAFLRNASITKVTIPETVTTIGSKAFYFCKALTTVNLPKSLTTMGTYAFNNCTALQNLTFPEGLTTIGNYAFVNCDAMTSVVLPSTIRSLGKNLFAGCDQIAEVTIPEGLIVIGENAFYNMPKVTAITIPASVTQIGNNAFTNSGVKAISFLGDAPVLVGTAALPSTATLYANTTASGWTFPTWTAANGVTYTTSDLAAKPMVSGDYTYQKTSDTEIRITAYTGSDAELVIPSTIDGYTVTSIGTSVFKGNTTLTSVTLPDTLLAIGTSAFYNCTKLVSVTIPYGVQTISSNAFRNCDGISEITIPQSVQQISSYAFSECDGLVSFEIPESVTTIGNYVFYHCSALASVKLPSSMAAIPSGLFSYCSNLQSVVIPASVTSIGASAFYQNDVLEALYFEGDAPEITSASAVPEMTVFYTAGNTQGWTYPLWTAASGVTYAVSPAADDVVYTEGDYQYKVVGGNARIVRYTGSASELGVPSILGGYTVDSIGKGTFAGQTALTRVVLPDTIKQIDNSAFRSCSALVSIDMPQEMTYLGNYMFADCSSLASITIPDGLTTIPLGTFNGCTALQTISLPDDIISTGTVAFRNCTALSQVNLSENIAVIGSNTFYGCTALTELTFPASLTTLYSNAFINSGVQTLYFYGSAPTVNDNNASMDNITLVTLGTTNGWTYPTWTASNGRTYNTTNQIPVCDGFMYRIVGSTSVEITGYSGTELAVAIPATIGDLPVTAIAEKAFMDNTTMQSIVIPDSVTSIGAYAFNGCTALTTVTLPANLTVIADYTFDGCSSLTGIILPAKLTSIGIYAFYGCTALTALDLPATLTKIGGTALWGTGITELKLPDTLTDLNAISICNAGLKNVYVSDTHPQYVSSDGIVFTRDMKTLVFYPTGRTGTYSIPAGVTTVEDMAFVNSKLTNILFPDTVTYVGRLLTSLMLRNLYFYGNLPSCGEYGWFSAADTLIENVTVYYVEGKNGWTTPTLTINAGGKYEETYDTALFTAEGYTYTKPDDTQVTITGYIGSETALAIPAAIGGLPVTSIGEGAFQNNGTIQSVIIPNSVTVIGAKAFQACAALTTVTLPNGLTQIAENTFRNSGLISIDIPASVTLIDKYAFWYCYSLTSVTLHEGLIKLATNAFESCSLTEIALPASLQSVTFGTFSSERLEKISVAEDNPYFTAVDGVLFSEDMKTIVAYPGARTGSYTIPDGVEKIAVSAFRRSQLTALTIPASVTYVDHNVFFASALTSVTFMGDVPEYSSSKWTGDGENLIIYYIEGKSGWTTPTWTKSEGESMAETFNTQPLNLELTYGDYTYLKSSDTTATITGYTGSATTVALPAEIEGLTVTAIKEKAFKDNTTIQSVVIPDSVTSIGTYAFSGCTALTSVTLPVGLETIAEYTFNASGLQTINIPESVRCIEKGAFNKCAALTAVTLPDGLLKIEGRAFCYSGLKSIAVPESVYYLGGYAFGYCTALTSAKLPSTLQSISGYLFVECSALTEVNIPSSVTHIGNGAFWHCTSLTSLTLPEGVTWLPSYAFGDCGIKTLVLPSTLKRVDLGALSGSCYENFVISSENEYFTVVDGVLFSQDMKTIVAYPGARTGSYTIPDGVETIAVSAFCSSQLTELHIPASVTYACKNIFSLSALTDVYFYGDVPAYDEARWQATTTEADITLHFIEGKTGWTTPTWTKSPDTNAAETFNTKLISRPVVSGLAWNLTDGTITWGTVDGATGYEVQMYCNGTLMSTFSTTATAVSYGDLCTLTGDWFFCVRSLGTIDSLWATSVVQHWSVVREVAAVSVTAINGSEWTDVLSRLPAAVSLVLDDGTTLDAPVVWATDSVSGYDKSITACDQVFAISGTVTVPADCIGTTALSAAATVTVLKQQIVLRENTSTSMKIETKLDSGTEPDTGTGGEAPAETPAYLIGVQASVASDTTAPVSNTVENVVAEIDESIASKVTILAADGETELAADAVVGTGSIIQLKDENNNVIDEVVIVVTGDATGDGKIDQGDLEALETVLSAKQETADSFNDAQKAALNMNGEDSVNAIDLRDMLIKLGGN